MNILPNFKPNSIEEFANSFTNDLLGFMRKKTESLINELLEEEIIDCLEKTLLEDKKTRRNGFYTRLIKTELGPMEIRVPRDRLNLFETKILKPYQRRTLSLDEMIQDYYLSGLTATEISESLCNNQEIDLSRETIRKTVNKVLGESEEFNKRDLPNCPFIYLDGTYVSFKRYKDNTASVEKECCMIAMGVTEEGKRVILGFYFTANEGASSWVNVLEDLKRRGVNNPKLFITDGLQGMPNAIQQTYPMAKHQICLVHVSRNIVHNARKSDQKEIAEDFKKVYDPVITTKEEAIEALTIFTNKWSKTYPRYMRSLLQKENLFTYLEFPKELRVNIYTSNPIESFNSKLKRTIKRRIQFNSEDNAFINITSVCKKFNKNSKTIRSLISVNEFSRLNLGFII